MKKLYALLLTGLVTPLMVFADEPIPSSDRPLNTLGTPIQAPGTVIIYIQTIGNWIFSLLLALAVIYVLIAAFNYLTGSSGEGVEKAHKMILYAAIAITVAVFAKGIVYVIAALAGSPVTPGSI